MKAVVRFIYRARYGVRGAIKPPLNWNRTSSMLYRFRYRCWKTEAAIYRWTGLPDEWWAWMSGDTLSNRLRNYAERVAGGGPSDANYDPETLLMLHDAADVIENRAK